MINYDSPVAMPSQFVETPTTLDEYFTGLYNLMDEAGKSIKNQQVGGKHYQRGIQPWDIIDEWELDYWEGNVVKYILRWKHKDGLQDLKKAKHYLEYIIERESNDN